MGIASLVATDRFQTTAEQLSMLAVAQLIVYAAMQIPVGLLLDRWGPRRLLSIGALSMALGQYVVAFAPALAWRSLAACSWALETPLRLFR